MESSICLIHASMNQGVSSGSWIAFLSSGNRKKKNEVVPSITERSPKFASPCVSDQRETIPSITEWFLEFALSMLQ